MRKIIQILSLDSRLLALCNDGTLWEFRDKTWYSADAEIPQDTKQTAIDEINNAPNYID